ncbi:MAG: hypothetical protein IPP40_06905 [bacterium]|nr:hypothetical protein [bacterium]
MLTFKSNFKLCLLMLAVGVTSANAASLLSVRFGSHQGFDRMVCELSNATKYEVKQAENGVVELHLDNVAVSEKFFLPKLPPQIKLLTSVEAFLEGDHSIVIEIRGTEALFAKTTELKGASWRLALDLSKQSEQPTEPAHVEPTTAKPETTSTTKPQLKHRPAKDEPAPYVPGDKPIETILADKQESKEEPKLLHEEKPADEPAAPKHKKPAKTVAGPLLTADSLKALEVLAEFYDVMGDQDAAREYARLYLDKVDSGGSFPKKEAEQTATWPIWILVAIAFAAGIAGGIIGNRLRMPKGSPSMPKFRLSSLKLPKFGKRKDKAEELSEDLNKLDRAVASEKHKTNLKPQPKQAAFKAEVPAEIVKDAEEDFPEDTKENLETDMKESLMDRRVKRVMELNSQNRSLADIAKELDMGQDEVKLIIDLNS